MDKCEICAEIKITKKPCKSLKRETKLFGSVHSDLSDLKHTMTRIGKKFYVTFIDEHSTYISLTIATISAIIFALLALPSSSFFLFFKNLQSQM